MESLVVTRAFLGLILRARFLLNTWTLVTGM